MGRLSLRACLLAALITWVLLVPAASAPAESSAAIEYVVVFNDQNDLPDDAGAKVAAAGGAVSERLPQIGALTARSANPNFEAEMAATHGVRAVSENRQFQMIPENIQLQLFPTLAPPDETQPNGPAEPTGPDPQPGTDRLFNQQWDKMRMNVSDTGSYAVQRGRDDVVVAVIDTGADVLPNPHPDITPNLDAARSRSFVLENPPGGDPTPAMWDDRHGHGSWCLSAVGAPINDTGVSGVAPNVTLVALKVLTDVGFGFYFDIAEALVYAGDNRFDVASMSIGGYLNHSELQALYIVVQRAVEYARTRGVTPIAALGNDNLDLSDGAIMRDEIEVPGEVPGVIGVSATGYEDEKAYYSNYGVGKADVSAPGGDRIFQQSPPTYRGMGRVIGAWATEDAGAALRPNFETDCGTAGCGVYAWVQGTSMATPNAAGVAALIISQYGDFSPDNSQKLHMPPTEVESILQITANNQPCPEPRTVDYGPQQPATLPRIAVCNGDAGYNGFFGKGIVDALKAVTEYKKQQG